VGSVGSGMMISGLRVALFEIDDSDSRRRPYASCAASAGLDVERAVHMFGSVVQIKIGKRSRTAAPTFMFIFFF